MSILPRIIIKQTLLIKIFSCNLTFENVQKASQAAMKAFEEKQFDVVEIVYSQFKNAATQRFEVERFLPIPKWKRKKGIKKLISFMILPKKNW